MKSEQIQQEILKILFGLKEMNSSLTIMSSGWAVDRPLNPTMLQTFVQELHKLLQKSITFSSSYSTELGMPILQCKQQSIKSSLSQRQQTKQSKQRSYQIRIQNESNDPTEIDVVQLVNLNHELSQENEELTKKLEEAGLRISALEDEINLIEKSQYHFKQQGSFSWEIKKLRAQLDKAEQLLAVNNEEFIEEIQKYNERIWRNQRQIQAHKVRALQQRAQLEEKDFIISKLKLKNMDLEMNSRIRGRSESIQATDRSPKQFVKMAREREKDKQLQFSKYKN